MRDTILVFTSSDNGGVDDVINRLVGRGEKVCRFNTDEFPASVFCTTLLSGAGLSGSVIPAEDVSRVELNSIKSCWYRGVRSARLPMHTEAGHDEFIRAESKAALWALFTSLDVFWMNQPLVGTKLIGNNKLYQLKTASAIGLSIPETIITNDPNQLLLFCRENGGEVAIKLLSGNVFIKDGSDRLLGVYTQRVSEADISGHYDEFRISPVLAQRYIQKKIELRVTVVGQKIFACAIHSQDSAKTRDDWRRYDFKNVRHEQYQLPVEIGAKILKLMRLWGLQFGAVDMILTPDEEYVFLEVNPQGQWDWIEKLTKMPISEAIVDLLANPPQT